MTTAMDVTAARKTRLFLLDDHDLVREGIAALLGEVPDFEVVGAAGSVGEALPRIRECRPDVAVLDARLPDGNGIELCREIRSSLPGVYCLILTSYDDEDALLAAVLAGASGYVLKEVRTAALVDAIRQVALGRTILDTALIAEVLDRLKNGAPVDPRLAGLTERERELLDLVADGLTNREIAQRLFLADKTVKNYVSTLLHKLGMDRRAQAALLAIEIRQGKRAAVGASGLR